MKDFLFKMFVGILLLVGILVVTMVIAYLYMPLVKMADSFINSDAYINFCYANEDILNYLMFIPVIGTFLFAIYVVGTAFAPSVRKMFSKLKKQ